MYGMNDKKKKSNRIENDRREKGEKRSKLTTK